MRLSDLRDAKVKNVEGETIGRIHEVHAEGGKIVAVSCGSASLIERLTARSRGKRIPWERVVKITASGVVVAPDAKTKNSSSRTRKGIRRPSGRPSNR